MPAPIPEDKRAAILDDIQGDDEQSCRGIGRKHGVSDATVRKIAKDAGIVNAFSRAQTENATRARVADMKSDRTKLAKELLGDAERLRDRAWSEYAYFERTKDRPERVILDLPPLSEVRHAYTSIGIAIDKHVVLERHDADAGAEGARSVLGALAAGLQLAAEQIDGPVTPVDE
ncbi:hypothetical protein [Streptomyces sp.]|uniref:hypothetical protein n=1 Tax=Streptomyces sp. TaxID=1931 RepID=UPI002F92E20E